MSRPRPHPAGPALLALGAMAVLALSGCGEAAQTDGANSGAAATGPPGSPQVAEQPTAPKPEETFTATLLFADDAGRLKEERRDLPSAGTPLDRARRVVEALIDGPHDGLTAILPVETQLRALYLGSDGTAYVDFDAGLTRGLAEGSEDALLAARSLADTLAANFDDVRQVRILVEGSEVSNFGGHLDLSRPIPARSALR